MGIAPAARSRATCGASRPGTAPISALIPWVVGVPARSMFSLTVNGTPCSGPSSPPSAVAWSAAFAASGACSLSTTVTALTDGFTASIRRRCASMTSWLDAWPDLIASAKSMALIRHRPVAAMLMPILPPGVTSGALLR